MTTATLFLALATKLGAAGDKTADRLLNLGGLA
jgi:hypothetical protein